MLFARSSEFAHIAKLYEQIWLFEYGKYKIDFNSVILSELRKMNSD